MIDRPRTATMKLKTFRASSMADALAAVKKDLGKDAVILHTKQVRVGGLFGLGRKSMVEVTASDEQPPARRDQTRTGQRSATTSRPEPSRSREPRLNDAARDVLGPLLAGTYGASRGIAAAVPGASAPATAPAPALTPALTPTIIAAAPRPESMTPTATPSVEVKPGPLPAQPPLPPQMQPQVVPVRQRRGDAPTTSEPVLASSSSGASASGDSPASDTRLYKELADIKLLVAQVLQTGTPPAEPGSGRFTPTGANGTMPEALFRQYLRLLEAAVARELADTIVGKVRDELTAHELADDTIVRTAVLKHLSGLIPVADVGAIRPCRSATGPRRPLTIALVGPTGVGKTTTLAKLAATYKLRHGRSVALITSDTYRIAAVDQLRTYAGIIGLPVRVVMSQEEMSAAIETFANFDVVLIDTAGRSQNARDRLSELAALLESASPDETHLVLSSTASESVLLKTAERFACVKPNRVILTKLDEAVNFGVVVNIAHRLSARLSFVTTGQEVPDHIEPSRPDRLARMILDNGLTGVAPASGALASPGRVAAERRELLGSGV
jgi:flagellar biosynthesis protein FlhF